VTEPLHLTAEEARVAGSLAEKQLATPQYYPLTLNALVNACNQTNNRDPIVSYDEPTVAAALDALREKGVARLVHPGGGSRVTKYRHVLDERLGLDARELALVCVLLLRGPQTLNELRTRTERLADFDGASAVERDLERLADERQPPLVQKLERQPGQKEARYASTLVDLPAATARAATAMPRSRSTSFVARPALPSVPRLHPLAKDDLDDDQRELLGQAGVDADHLFRTLVRHPGLFRRWLPFGGKLLAGGKLPARVRELLILRTAHLTGAAYEWGHHVEIGRGAGLTDDEVRAVADAAPGAAHDWSVAERAALDACDELCRDGMIGDGTWAALVAAFDGDERQLVEVPMLVGHYRMLAGVVASLGIQPEDGLAPLLPPG
jgi:uncharacterized protein YceH (UPF0502 family)/alkylhydroperoxidase family enzyme